MPDQRAGTRTWGSLVETIEQSPVVLQLVAMQNRADQGVIQRTGDGDKKKGEDLCNNVGKTMQKFAALPDFITDAIQAVLDIINANRGKCTVATSSVSGADTNTQEYGDFADALNGLIGQIALLIGESDKGYFRDTYKTQGGALIKLLGSLPNVAVDDRVQAVIQAGGEGDAGAMGVLLAALVRLRDLLIARIKAYAQVLWEHNRKGPDKGGGGGDNGSAGGAAGSVGGQMVAVGGE